ncbi:phage integrase [Bacillus sp. JCM 19047]|nr:phage integrase [Bacillus sp. JCM 19047]
MKGHIRKRGNKYVIVVDLERDHNNERRQKWFSGYDTKKAAQKDMPRILNEINTGNFIEPSKESFAAYLEKWILNKRSRLKASTFQVYKTHLRIHIIPKLGNYKLEKLNRLHLKTFFSYLENDLGLAPATIKKVHTVISSALSEAVEDGIVGKNAAAGLKTARIERKEIHVWDEKQLLQFLNSSKHDPLYIAFHLAAMTGMRRSEVLGLRWKDVDFKNSLLRTVVTHTPYGASDGKTKASFNRTIDLDEVTITELQKRKERVEFEKERAGRAYKDNDLVVGTSLGTHVTPRNLNRKWYKLKGDANVPSIRFHDLRHTHATLMLLQGIPVKVVAERLGHSSITTTLDTYNHLLPSIQREAIAMFSDNLYKLR